MIKTSYRMTLAVLLGAALCQSAYASSTSSADRIRNELSEIGVQRFTASDYKPGLVKHIVLFRYKTSTSLAQQEVVKRRFLALVSESKRDGHPYIVSIETGTQNSGEGVDQGLQQGFIVTFRSEGDRNYYVGQPIVSNPTYYDAAHQAFKNFVGPLLDKKGVVVFDFAADTKSN